jgi:hypothetical protein
MDCFAEPVIGRRFAPTRWLAMTGSYSLGFQRTCEPNAAVFTRRAEKFPFIIFVDAIFTTLFERPFTNVFDVIGAKSANHCVCRACNAD